MNLFAASIPLHPLLVHMPVVLVPLLFVGAVAMAIWRPWFDRFGVLVGGLAVIAGVGTALASQSGEELQTQVADTAAVRNHVELGDQAKLIILAFLVALLGWIALNWWLEHRAAGRRVPVGRSRAGAVLKGLAVASIVLGAFATGWVIRAGHAGAQATWEGRVTQTGG